jgi:hypothetical protein
LAVLPGCQSGETTTRYTWWPAAGGAEAQRRAEAACVVEMEKARAPYAAVDNPIEGNVVGRRVFVACMRARGFELRTMEIVPL